MTPRTKAAIDAARAVPAEVAVVRARWVGARRVGPWSRHPESVRLLGHAQADIETLLGQVETTRGDEVGALCHTLAGLDDSDITVRALRPLAGTRGRYEVTWSSDGRRSLEDGWPPAIALRKAVRVRARAHGTESDAVAGGQS